VTGYQVHRRIGMRLVGLQGISVATVIGFIGIAARCLVGLGCRCNSTTVIGFVCVSAQGLSVRQQYGASDRFMYLGSKLYLAVFGSQAYRRDRLSGSQGISVRGLSVRGRISTVLVGT
jgi:hypothetical protein